MWFALLVLAQVPDPPAVGDTVWIRRVLTVPAGMSVRPRPIPTSALVQPLGPPEVSSSGREITIRYPVVFWRPGTHRIEMPAVIVVRSDGFSDTLAAGFTSIEVRSVLPPGAKRDSLAPAPPAEAVARSTPSPLPVILLLLLVLLALLPLHWWWRKRGSQAPSSAPTAAGAPNLKEVGVWVEAGELHAAADAYARLLEPRVNAATDPALSALVARLVQARYGAVAPAELLTLCRDAARAAGA